MRGGSSQRFVISIPTVMAARCQCCDVCCGVWQCSRSITGGRNASAMRARKRGSRARKGWQGQDTARAALSNTGHHNLRVLHTYIFQHCPTLPPLGKLGMVIDAVAQKLRVSPWHLMIRAGRGNGPRKCCFRTLVDETEMLVEQEASSTNQQSKMG